MSPARARLLGVSIFAVYCLTGCVRADDTYGQPKPPPSVTIPLSPGAQVSVTEHTTTTEKAAGTGIGATASGDKADLTGKDFTPPGAALPGGATATGGGGSLSANAESVVKSTGFRIALALLGALLIAAPWVIRRFNPLWSARQTINCSLAGLACILIAWLWAYLIVALAVGFVVVCLVLFYETHGGASVAKKLKDKAEGLATAATGFKEALRAVVAGVSTAPAEAAAVVKAEIAKHAEPNDKTVIGAVKREDGLA